MPQRQDGKNPTTLATPSLIRGELRPVYPRCNADDFRCPAQLGQIMFPFRQAVRSCLAVVCRTQNRCETPHPPSRGRNFKGQAPCLSWFWSCRIGSSGFRSIHLRWMILSQRWRESAQSIGVASTSHSSSGEVCAPADQVRGRKIGALEVWAGLNDGAGRTRTEPDGRGFSTHP
jgi:hypothetical protein